MSKARRKAEQARRAKVRRQKRILAAAVLVVIAAVAAVLIWNNQKKKEEASAGDYTAEIAVKDYGTITVELDGDAAPETVKNFVSLAESGFYDGLTFHRIIDGFMIQGGDPNGDGTGGSEETIPGEFSANGFDNPLSHTRGTISMARSQDYDSASSQFFIMQEDTPSLDGQYAAFGHVTSGMEVVDAICEDAVNGDANGVLPAEDQPVIESITITDGKTE
ncbi:MAG TPA: peptidylprolyl isomerase [Candidatus Scatomonas merdigallinarum]|nr:peptidylprolyl isomerase [Candidatus Scatomonas merdigallinarum]